MGQRGYKQLTERDRVLISQLREKKLSLSEIARRIGKDKSTISRELRRNAIRLTPWDRYFYFCIERFWGPDDLARYLKTKSAEERRTIKAWMHRDAQSWATDRKSRAQRARRSPRRGVGSSRSCAPAGARSRFLDARRSTVLSR